jgi:hypothetical protein
MRRYVRGMRRRPTSSTSGRARRVLRELARRRRRSTFQLTEHLLHPKQLRSVSHATGRRKVILGGRRGGKTRGIAAALLWLAATLGWRCLYVTLTRQNAKEIIWDDLLELNERYCLGGKVQLQDLSLRFPNGGVIALRGANNEREIGKIRGKKWHLAVIDECQSIPDRVLVPLLGPVLAATLLDFGGSLWLAGSRPAVRAGHWFEVTEGKFAANYEQHRYDIRDNTFLPARLKGRSIEDILDEFRKDQGWSEADPTYRREVLNEDIQDLEALLFQFGPEVNVGSAPECHHFVFGVDQGSDDADAIAVLGWRDDDPTLYLVEEFVQSKQDVTDLAAALKERIEKYAPRRIVIDQGGGGKKSAEEIRRRHHIALEAAEKHDKPGFIKLLNADLRKGKLKCAPGSRFEEDCRLVRKDPEGLMRDILQELPRKKGGYHSDICDAVLYGWRAARHYLFEPPEKKPEVPPADEMEQRRMAKIREQAERERQWFETDLRRAA